MRLPTQNIRQSNDPLVPWLVLAIVLLLVSGFFAYSLYQEHGRIGKREWERLDTQAKVIDENLANQLDGLNRALEGILKDIPLWSGKNGRDTANHRLVALSDAMPGIHTFLITDAEGTITAANRGQVIGQNIRHREYFQTPLKNLNSSTLYVSPPFKTVLGNFVINVTRMISGPDGGFVGVVSATLDPKHFKVLLGSVLYASDMWAALGHGDGKLFLMVPELSGMTGQDLDNSGSLFTRHIESGRQATVLADGEERMIAQRTIRPVGVPMDKPLVVAVSRDMSALYADWRQDAFGTVDLLGVLFLTMTLALFFFQQRQRKFEAISASYEATQRDSAERLKLATEAVGLGVWDYDLETGRLTWDASMFTIFGKDPSRFSSADYDWRDTVLPEDLAGTETALQTAINGGEPFNTSFRICRGDGEVRIIRGVARVQFNETGKPVRVIGINEDITERQQEAEDLRQAKESAVTANAAKSRFLATVAHEFRTPLSLLISSTDILDRYGERLTAEKRTEQNGHIRSAARQMSSLIDSVLSFNRLETGRHQSSPMLLDVERVCRAIAEEVRTVWGSGHKFHVTINADCGTAMLDEILFRRILENLLTNAFRYTSAGGTVSLNISRDSNRLLMVIMDTGIGIPEEDQKLIFDEFYRGRNVEARRGLGLGLTIVHEALLRMGGTITLTSRIGEGTTMRVEIPIVDASMS